MTYQQSLERAELEAEMAFERFLEACEIDDHPEFIDTLHTEAHLANERYNLIVENDPAH